MQLTKRGKIHGDDIPMAGIPHHAIDSYLRKLIQHGFTVAICDQVEDVQVSKQLKKPIVERDVTRVYVVVCCNMMIRVTPGTLLEEKYLEARENNYLAALHLIDDHVAVAWMDMSTGEFNVMETTSIFFKMLPLC